MTPSLNALNACPVAEFTHTLEGIYEHSPWIAERAAALRPFPSLAALKLALQRVVDSAGETAQLALLRAHPELAGKAAIAGELTHASRGEQAAAGLDQCSPEEFATLQTLNARYNAKFGFPFILAVKGPDGKGLHRSEIIATLARRMDNTRSDELAEALRQVQRIAELRLHALFGVTPALGRQVLEWADKLAEWSDEPPGLTCAYLRPAHRKTAAQLAQWMRDAGMDVEIDALCNVVGRYSSNRPDAKTLMTGSHYDTVRNGGKYDGRAGILLAIAAVRHLHERGERLPFHLEVVAFSEEEGVRFASTFLGSSAMAGRFDPALLERRDADGISLREALQEAGHDANAIPAIARDPTRLLGFLEAHIEQGPLLLERGLPVGVVAAIAGSCRYRLELGGIAAHAGTTPMGMRRDAAAAAAEIVLYVEKRCTGIPSLVGTVGQLEVPGGSVNVVPGACRLSLDVRAADDTVRDAAAGDILREAHEICARRGIRLQVDKLMQAGAVPCSAGLMRQLSDAITALGLPPFALSSGAGHDAMMMATITDMAMLFVRCGNGGISHNPLESMTADDAEIAARVLLHFLRNFEPPANRF